VTRTARHELGDAAYEQYIIGGLDLPWPYMRPTLSSVLSHRFVPIPSTAMSSGLDFEKKQVELRSATVFRSRSGPDGTGPAGLCPYLLSGLERHDPSFDGVLYGASMSSTSRNTSLDQAGSCWSSLIA
jgi:hypothetical protein